MPAERTNQRQEEGTQCVLVLQVLRSDHEQPWTPAELERELHDVDPAAITVALQRLNEQGVVHMEDDQIEASPCARHLDALAFICI
jgi:hypothetical protein